MKRNDKRNAEQIKRAKIKLKTFSSEQQMNTHSFKSTRNIFTKAYFLRRYVLLLVCGLAHTYIQREKERDTLSHCFSVLADFGTYCDIKD